MQSVYEELSDSSGIIAEMVGFSAGNTSLCQPVKLEFCLHRYANIIWGCHVKSVAYAIVHGAH